MTLSNGAGVTEMAISVQVLTVDSKRRMSHKFFEQIPAGSFLDDDRDVADDAQPWGHVRSEGGPFIVGTRAGKLVRMNEYTATSFATRHLDAPEGPRPERGGDKLEWQAYSDGWNYVRESAEGMFHMLLRDLPQLYIGG